MARKEKTHPLVTFTAGGVAGILEISCTMPLDTLKTQMQLKQGANVGAVAAAREILGTRGIGGFYFGMSAMVAQVSIKAAIRFTAFEQIKFALKALAPGRIADAQVNFLGGLGAGIVEAAVWVTPTERLKVLRQKEIMNPNPKFTGMVGATQILLREQGPRGLFVGFVPTAARQGLAMAIRFMMYDEVKKVIVGEGLKASSMQSLAAGMVTGTVSSLINQPIDTAKSRLQAQEKGAGAAGAKYTGTVQCLMSLAKEEGLASWYRGSAPRVLRLTIGQGVIFASQEQISNALQRMFQGAH